MLVYFYVVETLIVACLKTYDNLQKQFISLRDVAELLCWAGSDRQGQRHDGNTSTHALCRPQKQPERYKVCRQVSNSIERGEVAMFAPGVLVWEQKADGQLLHNQASEKEEPVPGVPAEHTHTHNTVACLHKEHSLSFHVLKISRTQKLWAECRRAAAFMSALCNVTQE